MILLVPVARSHNGDLVLLLGAAQESHLVGFVEVVEGGVSVRAAALVCDAVSVQAEIGSKDGTEARAKESKHAIERTASVYVYIPCFQGKVVSCQKAGNCSKEGKECAKLAAMTSWQRMRQAHRLPHRGPSPQPICWGPGLSSQKHAPTVFRRDAREPHCNHMQSWRAACNSVTPGLAWIGLAFHMPATRHAGDARLVI